MKRVIELDVNDIRWILADHFGTVEMDVKINIRRTSAGYGLGEYQEIALTATVIDRRS